MGRECARLLADSCIRFRDQLGCILQLCRDLFFADIHPEFFCVFRFFSRFGAEFGPPVLRTQTNVAPRMSQCSQMSIDNHLLANCATQASVNAECGIPRDHFGRRFPVDLLEHQAAVARRPFLAAGIKRSHKRLLSSEIVSNVPTRIAVRKSQPLPGDDLQATIFEHLFVGVEYLDHEWRTLLEVERLALRT